MDVRTLYEVLLRSVAGISFHLAGQSAFEPVPGDGQSLSGKEGFETLPVGPKVAGACGRYPQMGDGRGKLILRGL